jgi:hypothetical protein
MSLFLEKTLYNGDVVRYHRIGKVEFRANNVIAVTLDSYRNYEERQIANLPVNSMEFTFQGTGGYTNTNQAITEGYNYIKSLPEWAEALDV